MQPPARIFLRPIANPLPLGFLALAGATLLVSALQLGWIDSSEGHAVALILVAFVFPLQLSVSILGFLARDVVAGTGMGLLAGTWLSVALITLDSPPGATSDALGTFLLLAAVAMTVPTLAALHEKRLPAAVLGMTGIRFAITGLYQLTASSTWADVAGITGLLLCALAVLAAVKLALDEAEAGTRDYSSAG